MPIRVGIYQQIVKYVTVIVIPWDRGGISDGFNNEMIHKVTLSIIYLIIYIC